MPNTAWRPMTGADKRPQQATAWRIGRALLLCAALSGVTTGAPAVADPRIVVVALFPGKAMLRIDGRPRALSVGQTSPEGVKLLLADAQSATLEVNAKRVVLGLDGGIQGTFSDRPAGNSVKLAPGANGHYYVDGLINGNAVPFVVDTGASVVAINKHVARRIGLLYRTDGTAGQIETASGMVRAYYLKFRQVKIRSLELRDVDGVVVDGDFPTTALLGQSFLNRLNMQREGMLLELREK